MTLETRLSKLDGLLSFKQYMLTLIAEMQQFDSFEAYSLSQVVGKWHRIRDDFEKITDGIEAKLKGQDRETIYHTTTKASREGVFLYMMLNRVITGYRGEHYRHAYNGLLLHHLWQRAQNESLRQLAHKAHKLEDLQDGLEVIRALLDTFKGRANRHLYHLFSERRVVEAISQRYFDGRELMFKQDRDKLETLTREALELIERVQEVVSESDFLQDRENNADGEAAPLVDVEAIRAEVERDLQQHVTYEVDMVRADVFTELGNRDKGCAIYEHYGTLISTGGQLRR